MGRLVADTAMAKNATTSSVIQRPVAELGARRYIVFSTTLQQESLDNRAGTSWVTMCTFTV